MALALRPRPVARPAPTAPVALTIEQVRERYAPGTFELVIAELKEKKRLDAITKEHGNAANRQGTKAKNALKLYATNAHLEPEDQILVDDTAYNYDVSYSEKVDTEALFDMLDKGLINRAQLIASVNVNKDACTKACGAHVVHKISKITPGKTMDIRSKPLDHPVTTPQVVKAGAKPVSKKLLTPAPNVPHATIKPRPAGSNLSARRRIAT